MKKENESIRNVNVIFNKNGNGFDSTKITIPVPWIRQLGFSAENREGTLELKDDKIILKKK